MIEGTAIAKAFILIADAEAAHAVTARQLTQAKKHLARAMLGHT